MKVTKLVIGILMIVFSLFIAFQSMAVGISDSMQNSKHVSGSAGIMVALFYLVAGIVYLATRKMKKLGGDIANMIILLITGIIGLSDVGVFSDLKIWSWFAIIVGVGFFVWHFLVNRKDNETTQA